MNPYVNGLQHKKQDVKGIQKQIDDIQNIIGNGALNDTIIGKINTMYSELQSFKKEQSSVSKQQTEQIEQQLKTLTTQCGKQELQTNSQDIVGAINELLSLIKQNISMNTIMIALNDISQEIFTKKYPTLQEQFEYFVQQIQAQILNYNNVLTVLYSSQDNVKCNEQMYIRYGYQNGHLFVEKYSKQSNVQDIRFLWDIQKGFYINYDYSPIVIKCYDSNIFVTEQINDEQLPSKFNGYIFGSLSDDRNIVQYNCNLIKASGIQIYGCEINGAVIFEKCDLEEVIINTKYYKQQASEFNRCNVINSKIYVPAFQQQQNFNQSQLRFRCCQILQGNTVESAYIIDINSEQYTQADIKNMVNENNTYLIDRNLLDNKYNTGNQLLCWEIDSLSKLIFNKCDFIIRDENSQKGSEIYINNSIIDIQNCKIIISSQKYSKYITQPVDKLSKNGLITIGSDITGSDNIISQSTLSASKININISDTNKQGSGFKSYIVKSYIYSQNEVQITQDIQCKNQLRMTFRGFAFLFYINQITSYKIIDSGDDSLYSHFAFQKGVSQSPYNFQQLKRFSQMLFYSISNIINRNSSYVTELDQPRQDASMDEQIIKLIIQDLTNLMCDELGELPDNIDIWEWMRLFLYPEYAFDCDKSSQQNIIYKFIHISIKLMVKNYKYDDYIQYQSIFKVKSINVTFNDFTNSLNQNSTDRQQMSYYQLIMQQALPIFSKWYQRRELKWEESVNQKQQIEQQLYTAGL